MVYLYSSHRHKGMDHLSKHPVLGCHTGLVLDHNIPIPGGLLPPEPVNHLVAVVAHLEEYSCPHLGVPHPVRWAQHARRQVPADVFARHGAVARDQVTDRGGGGGGGGGG